MSVKHSNNSGFMLAELIVAITILTMIIAGLAVSMDGFVRFNHYQLSQRRCIAAAQAQLDSITATGEPISRNEFERLWPKLTFTIEEKAGTGQWKGTKLVKVTTTGQSTNNKAKVTLGRYIMSTSESLVKANPNYSTEGGQ